MLKEKNNQNGETRGLVFLNAIIISLCFYNFNYFKTKITFEITSRIGDEGALIKFI